MQAPFQGASSGSANRSAVEQRGMEDGSPTSLSASESQRKLAVVCLRRLAAPFARFPQCRSLLRANDPLRKQKRPAQACPTLVSDQRALQMAVRLNRMPNVNHLNARTLTEYRIIRCDQKLCQQGQFAHKFIMLVAVEQIPNTSEFRLKSIHSSMRSQ